MSTRERILAAAMDVFAQFGYRRASMDQVADAAGLTRQAVYHHFSNKEALFRAAVEALYEAAFEAEIAAGLEAENAGLPLAEVLASQVVAKFRYVLECLRETSQMEELLSEQQLQTRDLSQRFLDRHIGMHVDTIKRVCRAQGLSLRNDVSPRDLARSMQIAIRGFSDLRLSALDDLARVVRLIVNGALAPSAVVQKTKTSVRKPQPRRHARSRS